MKIVTTLVVLGVALLQSQSVQSDRSIDPEIQKKIDDYIQTDFFSQGQIFGLGLAIVRNNTELLYTTGYGLANIEKGIQNSNESRFFIGSIGKSFTSVLVVKLLHEKFPELGEMALDTPIRKLQPELNFTMIDRFRSEQINFRDLLAHRVCLFNDDMQIFADPFLDDKEVYYRQRYTEEVCGFRTDFKYRDTTYSIAGYLAGQLVNKTYEDAMQGLLDELGMNNSFYLKRTDNISEMENMAMPYYLKDNETHSLNEGLLKLTIPYNAGGGLATTPNDMARYIRFHLNSGELDGTQIIPKDVMKWLTKPSSLTQYLAFKQNENDVVLNSFAYGLGLSLSSYDGWELIEHAGYLPPYVNHLSFYPGKGLGIYTTINTGPLRADMKIFHAFIFETLNGNGDAKKKVKRIVKKGYEMPKLAEKAEPKVKKQEYIIGLYGSGNLGDVNITLRPNPETNESSYFIEYGRWYHGWLEEIQDGIIYKINFVTDVVQGDYALGFPINSHFVVIFNDTLKFKREPKIEGEYQGSFKLNVTLDKLPVIPWSPGGCGYEESNLFKRLIM